MSNVNSFEPEPPAHLSETSKALWRKLMHGSRCWLPQQLALLQVALEALDRADQARREIDGTGLTVVNPKTGSQGANPLLKVERESRMVFIQAWKALGLQSTNIFGGV